MKNVIVTEKQLEVLTNKIMSNITENHEGGSYMSKQQLYTIATLAYAMWEKMDEGEQLEDWMESKIAQAEQSVVAVVKAYMYDEVEDSLGGMEKLDYNDLVIGK